jgi:hypothetical protein
MGKHREAVANAVKCADVGDLPPDYSKLLPKGVPPSETPSAGSAPADTTWYFPIRLPATNPTGVFIPQHFTYPKEVDVILFFHGNKVGGFGDPPTPTSIISGAANMNMPAIS